MTITSEVYFDVQGATLVDRIVSITAAHDYMPSYGTQASSFSFSFLSLP